MWHGIAVFFAGVLSMVMIAERICFATRLSNAYVRPSL